MQGKIKQFINFIIALKMKSKIIIGLLTLAVGMTAYVVFAAPNFTPGQTLDPNCSPSDPNCTVSTLAVPGSIGWQKNGNNVYEDATGNVGIGTSNPSAKLNAMDGIKQEVNTAPILVGGTTNGTNLSGADSVTIKPGTMS